MFFWLKNGNFHKQELRCNPFPHQPFWNVLRPLQVKQFETSWCLPADTTFWSGTGGGGRRERPHSSTAMSWSDDELLLDARWGMNAGMLVNTEALCQFCIFHFFLSLAPKCAFMNMNMNTIQCSVFKTKIWRLGRTGVSCKHARPTSKRRHTWICESTSGC